MILRTWRFLTIILVSLSMAMAFCHLLQLPPRMSYDGAQWVTTQSLYQLFGTVGALIEAGALLLATVLLLAVWRRRPAFQWTLFGTVCLLVAHGAWWMFIAPVNAEIAMWTPDTIPADWMWRRSQWEYTHAVRAILEILGLSALLLSVLVETPSQRPRRRAQVTSDSSQMSAPYVHPGWRTTPNAGAARDQHSFHHMLDNGLSTRGK
jgi:Na+/melibiose symporter-like transporter